MDVRWKWDAMSAEKFVEMLSSDGFLGDLLVKKQHLLGATVWEPVSDTEVIGHHLLRAAHLRSTGPDMQHVDRWGHWHATNEHFYRKVNGVWKFAGLRPNVRLNDFDFDKIFKGMHRVRWRAEYKGWKGRRQQRGFHLCPNTWIGGRRHRDKWDLRGARLRHEVLMIR